PQMFKLMHEFRVRIITSPAFTGQKVLGAILFERTMDGEVKGKPVPTYLWEDRGVVPFVKVDKGLAAEKDGVSLMKPMPDVEPLLKPRLSAACSAPRCAPSSTWRRRRASPRSLSSSSKSPTRSPSTG